MRDEYKIRLLAGSSCAVFFCDDTRVNADILKKKKGVTSSEFFFFFFWTSRLSELLE